jgi:NAD(P)-dependent dehydrogenase (short-subunit alcohol dehydrogenase family)
MRQGRSTPWSVKPSRLTKSMAGELGPKKIRVCAIFPVIGETRMTELFMGMPDTPQNRAKFLATIRWVASVRPPTLPTLRYSRSRPRAA